MKKIIVLLSTLLLALATTTFSQNWETRMGFEFVTHSPVKAVAFSPNGKLFAATDVNVTVIWRTSDMERMLILEGHSDSINTIAFSPDGTVLASGCRDKSIKLWNIITGECIRTLNWHYGPVKSVAFSPDGAMLASVGVDKNIILWQVADGKNLFTMPAHNDAVNAVAFSPDGKLIVTASDDQLVKLWDVKRFTDQSFSGIINARTYIAHSGEVKSVTFSPDGTMIASGGIDQSIKLWSIYNDDCLGSLNRHSKTVVAVAFTPNETLVSAGSDKTVRWWRFGANVATEGLSQGIGPIHSLAISHDGKMVASGHTRGIIKFWQQINVP